MNSYKSLFPIVLLTILTSLLWQSCSAPRIQSNAQPVSHEIWDSLLRKHVDDNGLVDYKGMAADSTQLNEYLQLLSLNAPNKKNWSDNEKMAYWINAYNAFTVDLILDYYPVNSIKDIKDGIPFVSTVWDIKFFKIAGEDFDLNNIEHGILRKDFDDPRVHFALVCASMSCPKLQNSAFIADKLDEQLNQAAREFLNEPFRNEISESPVKVSKLLDWYWGDFKDKYDSRFALIKAYSDQEIDTSKEVEFLEYNWELNEQTAEKTKLLN